MTGPGILGKEPPGEWADQGACRDAAADLWFPDRGESTREAKEVCRACPVRQECLDHALTVGERFGIWGGTSERERRRLRRSHHGDSAA